MASTNSSGLPNGSEYTGKRLLIFTAVFLPVQICCVALRYLIRYWIRGPWGLDDLIVLASLMLQISMAGISIGSVKSAGVGYHISYLLETAPDKVTIWAKYLVAIEFIYFGGVNVPKLAILALYYRLFPKKDFRMIIYILMGILVGLTISTVVTAGVACRPFSANWDPSPGACINKEAFFIWSSMPNIVTDIIMLVLPIRVVWKLHTTTRLKIGLTLTFAVGSLGLITSTVRFTTFFKHNSFIDGTWSAVDLIIWTQIEAGVYLISACLPTYRPLLERVGRGRILGILTRKTPIGYKVDNSEASDRNIPLKPRPGVTSQGFHRLGDKSGLIDPRITVTTNIHLTDELAV